ncbi:hypothetical protein DAPPUDRAFT_269666 [Daphnia pulex]|uniref:Uncharacterized protein n=1 Tax=Daphnia pulex TaxID=6669 RepID=E9HZL1_DAPPU|nr:hypothetical protein DAPPUDRAFT_269666 [Daphnia pulex]|eukprot:EFX62819.1 hypothetical protein DAPPUDRAFT_269666 [Daphnia pulex]
MFQFQLPEFNLQTGRPVCMSFTLEDPSPATPIPGNINLQKERAVSLSFTFEGRGDHYLIRRHMLLGVLSLMAGSTTGVPMSPWYGGNQTAPPYYPKATYATTSYFTEVYKYYTTKAPEFYTTTYAAPSHYTDALKCYTEAPADYSAKTVEYYTEAAKYFSAPIYASTTEAAKYYAVPTYYTEAALSYYVERKYYTDAPVHYNTTYATPQPPIYYTEAPNYYITKAMEFFTSIHAAPAYYTEAPITAILKRSSTTLQPTLPRATTPTFRINYGAVLLLGVVSSMAGLIAGVAISPGYGGNKAATPPPSFITYATTSSCTEVFKYYTTKAPEFYTTYAALSHYTDALKSAPSYYTTKATESYIT